jgi:hypothetical protein
MAARSAIPAAGPDPKACGTRPGTQGGGSSSPPFASATSWSPRPDGDEPRVAGAACAGVHHRGQAVDRDRAYALSFGSLLLFCGRLADLIGRRAGL